MICDRVGIVVKGKLLATGRVDELVNYGHPQSVEIVCEGLHAGEIPAIRKTATRVLQQGQRCLVVLHGSIELEEILDAIRFHGGRLISVVPQKGSLEDLFLQQTGSKA